MTPPTDESAAEAAGEPGSAPPPTARSRRSGRRRAARALLFAASAAALLLVASILGALSALHSAIAISWLLARVPGVEARGITGAPLGGTFGIEHLRIALPGGTAVAVEALRIEQLHFRLRPAAPWFGARIEQVDARAVEVTPAPAAAPAGAGTTVPATLELPLAVELPAVAVGRLAVAGSFVLTGLRAALTLAADGGAAHRLEKFAFDWQHWHAEGSAAIATRAPLALDASAAIATTAGAPWPATARLAARGTLERPLVDATLDVGAPAATAAAVRLQATLSPFARWPLAALAASADGVDLSQFAAAAPRTRISGRAELQAPAAGQPFELQLELRNDAPGRWDERRLPLRRVDVRIGADALVPQAVTIERFDAALGAGADGGHLGASGRWDADRLTLTLRLSGVRPHELDSRAAALTLDGPLAIELGGLPTPDGRPAARGVEGLAGRLHGAFDGRLDAAPEPVRIELDAAASARGVEQARLALAAGAARLTATGSLARSDSGDWHARAEAQVERFDPLVWWPGRSGSAWNRGPHLVAGTARAALALPRDLADFAAETLRSPALALARASGEASLRSERLLLAGVPSALELRYAHADARSAVELHASARVGANRAQLDARLDPARAAGARGGAGDRWNVEVDAPALAALAPVAALLPGSDGLVPERGRASAHAELRGRWPAIATGGRLALDDLESRTFVLRHAALDWRLGTAADAPLALAAEVDALHAGASAAGPARWAVDHASATLAGSIAAHRWAIDARLPVEPPPWLRRALGVAGAGTRVEATGAGGWQPDPAGGGTWNATQTRVVVDAAERAGAAAARWLELEAPAGSFGFAADGRWSSARVEPGTLRVGGTPTLAWERSTAVAGPGGRTDLELHARIDALPVAALLARLQPEAGWSGDLALRGRLDLRAAERVDAELVIERQTGDLELHDAFGGQALGLEAARVTLSVHDGRWRLSQVLAGRALGTLDAAVGLQAAPADRWPSADAALEGRIRAQVADLGAWAPWIPAGWRLAGELRGDAQLGGRLGAPLYSGALAGSRIGLRNLLQGVNLGPGELELRFEEDGARIERFVLAGGEGTLRIGGAAHLGATPSARFDLHAERFRVLGRIDRRIVASGDATLRLDAAGLRADGRVTIDEGQIDLSAREAPVLDDDVTVHSGEAAAQRPGAEPAAAATAGAPRVDLELAIDLGGALRLRGRGIDTRLAGTLRATTPAGRLAVDGTVHTVGGTYAAYGQQLEIARGNLEFVGSIDDPRLDVLALRPNLDVAVGVEISGDVLNPRVRLYADDASLSDTDKLSWLLLGRAPDGLGRDDAALLQRAALALLAGENGPSSGALLRNLGLDELSVRQTDDGTVRQTVVSLGKQLSRHWYVGYERGINAAAGAWQLVYRIARRFTLRAQSGEDSSLDLIWTWRRGVEPAQPAADAAAAPR